GLDLDALDPRPSPERIADVLWPRAGHVQSGCRWPEPCPGLPGIPSAPESQPGPLAGRYSSVPRPSSPRAWIDWFPAAPSPYRPAPDASTPLRTMRRKSSVKRVVGSSNISSHGALEFDERLRLLRYSVDIGELRIEQPSLLIQHVQQPQLSQPVGLLNDGHVLGRLIENAGSQCFASASGVLPSAIGGLDFAGDRL